MTDKILSVTLTHLMLCGACLLSNSHKQWPLFCICFKSFYPFHCKNGQMFSFTFRSVYEILFQNGGAYNNKKLTI